MLPEPTRFARLQPSQLVLAAMLLLWALRLGYFMSVLPDNVLLKPGYAPAGTLSKWTQLAMFLAIGALPVLLFFWLPRLILRAPDGLKLPNREYWLAPERREQTAQSLARGVRIFALWLLACMLLMFEGTFKAQLDPRTASAAVIIAGAAGILLSGLGIAYGLSRFEHVPDGRRRDP